MKIMLISTNTMIDPYPAYPIGLDYVAHAVPPHHEVMIVDLNDLGENRTLAGILSEEQPDLIGLSIRNIDNTEATNVKSFSEGIGDLIRLIRLHTRAKVKIGRASCRERV